MEGRQSQRVDFEVSVDYESDDNFFTGFVRNISDGGLFISTPTPLPIGATLSVQFRIPTLSEAVTLKAVVRWLRPNSPNNPDMPAGMGVAFKDLTPNVEKAINAFIAKHDTIFFDDD